jgi:stage II sporulation protein D
MAAIAAYMSSGGKSVAAQRGADADTRAVSKWRAQALVEGVSAARSRQAKPGAWTSWKAVFVLLLVAMLGNAGVAGAWAADDGYVADEAGSYSAEAGQADSLRATAGPGSIVAAANPVGFGQQSEQAGIQRSAAGTETDSAAAADSTEAPQLIADAGASIEAEQAPPPILLKVGLVLGIKTVQIDAPDGATVVSLKTSEPVALLPPHSHWTVTSNGAEAIAFAGRSDHDFAKLATDDGGFRVKHVAYQPTVPMHSAFSLPPQFSAALANNASGYVVVPSGANANEQLVACNGRVYRGAIWLRPTHDTVSAINIVDLEDYLLSVLPSEMPSTWPSGALQAQAIAARSYAVANLGKHGKDGYDLRATTDDQVYNGVASEHQASNDAVAATNGLVIKHDGKPISAFFHSTSGGCTELSENVWSRPLPYLKSVIDYDDNSPHFSWTRKVSCDDFEKAFTKDVGQVLAVIVISRTAANRVKDAMVVGSQNTTLVSGNAIRLALKLPSSNFNIGYEENSYTFAGRGFGHGLGMSQYGARALAEQGYNAAQILAYYYRDVTVDYIAGTPGI